MGEQGRSGVEGADGYTAFGGEHRIATGDLRSVAIACKEFVDGGGEGRVVIFENDSGRLVDLSLRGTRDEVERRAAEPAQATMVRGRGRPKLGVVAKEVTLLPRHWAWLAAQRGSASATLRRLIDEARRTHEGRDRVRRAQDAAYRFMSVKLGNQPGYEEALRALYACDQERFDAESARWPEDLRSYCVRLAADAFSRTAED